MTTNTSTHTGAGRHQVIYAGRFIDQVAGAELPNESSVLGEQDTLPGKLAAILDRADTLILLDPLSFPYREMADDFWDVPMVVVLPPGSDAKSLIADLGPELFEHLGFFDRIATPDPDLREKLRRKYCWADTQRLPVISDQPGGVAVEVCDLLEAEARILHSGKASHRVQAAALEPRVVAEREERGVNSPLDVLEVGAGAGRWVLSFDPVATRFVGLDSDEDAVNTARANFPDRRFDRLASDLLFPYDDESFDLAFSVNTMHFYSTPAKRTLLYEMWRVTRPAGRLLFLEDFVAEKQLSEPTIFPLSVSEFVDLILEATAGRVVLEHVESLRYPRENLFRGGVLSLLRLGVPGLASDRG